MESVDTVAGYTTYIDLIRPLIHGKRIIATGMTREVDRVQDAINVALSGNSCAIVCSGDSGIYAMAGLAFEICEKRKITIVPPTGEKEAGDPNPPLRVEVVPGIPALSSGASLLGAPLTHDFAVISLSDLLTPWEVIERRLAAAAQGDFVIVLYNPKSKKRRDYIKKAQKIVLRYRNAETPVGVVVGAMRKNQDVTIVPLKALDQAYADMQTIIFIGNSTSRQFLNFMYTPRGYAHKYTIK